MTDNGGGKLSATPVRLLIADDHHVVRRALVALLDAEPTLAVVAETGDGREAVLLWQRKHPDVALLDLRMPGLDGIEATRLIRAEAPDARIIILTTFDLDDGIYAAVRAGAQAYLLKDVTSEELIACIHHVHAGHVGHAPALSPSLASRLGELVPSPRGGLAAWQLRRVQEHMEANLDRELGLTELAGVAELSEGHFSRAFRQSTGQSPYRHLTQRRIERAKQHLLNLNLGLAEIALLVGYANQTRFGERFREVTGTSPSLWRRDKLG